MKVGDLILKSTMKSCLLIYIHSHRFQYYLSGVYFWESFRAQTVSLLLDCVANQVIPLFHYCSDCVNDGLCPHECCNLWLQNACNRKGIVPVDKPDTSGNHNLMLLADAASKELKINDHCDLEVTKQQKSKPGMPDSHHRSYIQKTLLSQTVSRGIFKERMGDIKKKALQLLQTWCDLTSAERKNLHRNVQYADNIINQGRESRQVKNAGSLPFMQLQGMSNYCGLCALNNLLGKETISIKHMNNIADDLWLRQIEQCGQPLTENLQCHRDINGFYSFHTIEEVLDCFGYSLDLLSANDALRTLLGSKSYSGVLEELVKRYGKSIRLLFVDLECEHYTVVHVENNVIWHFDSKQRTPKTLTTTEFISKLRNQYETTYALQQKKGSEV